MGDTRCSGDFFAGLKVMVTGGLGFIGSNLARTLVHAGARVTVVDALIPDFGGNRANLQDIAHQADIQVIDLRDSLAMRRLVTGCDVIFNLAGNVSHIDSMVNPVTDLNANVLAQIEFLEACRACAPSARLVYASTRQIYGRPQYLPVDEKHPLQPVDVNGINKMAAEAYHTLYHDVYGLWTTSLRLTNTYGPRMRVKDARQTFLGIWIRKAVENGTFDVWDGRQRRDLTYVDDVVDACLRVAALAEAAGQVYNVGGCPPVTLLDLATALTNVAGSGTFKQMDFPHERKRIDIGDYFADDRLFRALTGWAPLLGLEDGLARTVSYYREHLANYV